MERENGLIMWLLTVLRCQRNQFAEKKTGKEDPLRSPSGRFDFFCNFQENENFKEIAETGKERVVCRICEEQKVLFWS